MSFFKLLVMVYVYGKIACSMQEKRLNQSAFTCTKLKMETLEQCFNFEHILTPYSSVSIVNFENVIAGWIISR